MNIMSSKAMRTLVLLIFNPQFHISLSFCVAKHISLQFLISICMQFSIETRDKDSEDL